MEKVDEITYNDAPIGETINPSWLLQPTAFDPGLWSEFDDESFDAFIRSLDPNATPTGSPQASVGLSNEPSAKKEALLLTPESGNFLASESSSRYSPLRQHGKALLECAYSDSSLSDSQGSLFSHRSDSDRFAKAKLKIKRILETATAKGAGREADLDQMRNLLLETYHSLHPSEGTSQDAEQASSQGRKRMLSKMSNRDANDSDESWKSVESTLEVYSQLIDTRLEGCYNSSLLIPHLCRRERRVLRAQAHMKRLNHLSFGKGASRCLLVSRHGILDRETLTRTGCAFVDVNDHKWIDLTAVTPYICHKVGTESTYAVRRARLVFSDDTLCHGCDVVTLASFTDILKAKHLPMPLKYDSLQQGSASTIYECSDDTARVCAALHCLSQSPSGTLKMCFPLTRTQNPKNRHSELDTIYEELSNTGTTKFHDGSNASASASSDSNQRVRKRQKRMPRDEGGYRCLDPRCKDKKVFDAAGELRKHGASHQYESRWFTCQECDWRFLYPKDLRRHLETHRRSRSASVASSSLEVHSEPDLASAYEVGRFDLTSSQVPQDDILAKTNENFSLDISQAMLTQESELPESDRPRSLRTCTCVHCFSQFATRTALRRHEQSNHSDKDSNRFECVLCSARFYRKDVLLRHQHQQHMAASFECVLCAKKFKSQEYLRQHVDGCSNRTIRYSDQAHSTLAMTPDNLLVQTSAEDCAYVVADGDEGEHADEYTVP